MQKTRFFIPLLICLILASACNNQKTPQELLKEENQAISRFIDKHGFTILTEYPQDGIFKEKEFFRDVTGLYIHVIDSGNGTRVKQDQTVLGRFSGLMSFKDDTIRHYTGPYQPDEFIYGRGVFSGNSCVAWEYALHYVGDVSEVRLIVPSSIGTFSDRQNYSPVYFESLKLSLY